MPYYLSSYIGVGTTEDPFRPAGTDGVAGWSSIDLRPDGGATLGGGGLNACLLYLPVASSHPSLFFVANDQADAIGQSAKNQIRSRLGVSAPLSMPDCRGVVAELLLPPKIASWPAVYAGSDRILRVHLGPLQWMQGEVGGGVLPFADNFNRADETPLGGNWSQATASSQQTRLASNHIEINSGSNNHSVYYWNADTFGADQYAELRITALGGIDGGPACRVDKTSANRNLYHALVTTATSIDIGKFVNGSYTAIKNLPTTVATNSLVRLAVIGSTLTLYNDGVEVGMATDTALTAADPAGFRLWAFDDDWDDAAGGNTPATHTFDTNLRFEGTGNPLTSAYTCGTGTTILTLGIVVGSATLRTGGAPTYNGVALTQADSTRQFATTPETSCELWYMLAPPTGSSLTISVPNSGSLTLHVQASSYKAPSGMTSALDVATGGTGDGANPSVNITPTVDGAAVVAVMGHGRNTPPTGNNWVNLNMTDDGLYSDDNQYQIQPFAGQTASSWTVAADDWCMVVAAFKIVTVGSQTRTPPVGAAALAGLGGVMGLGIPVPTQVDP